MEAPLPTPDAPLPTDVPTLHKLVRELLAEIARLRAENAALQKKLDEALRKRGHRSERRRRPKPDRGTAM